MSWKPKEDVWWIPWKFQGLQRVRLFIWLAFKQRLLTNMERVHRGNDHSLLCGICEHSSKNVLHAIWDCTDGSPKTYRIDMTFALVSYNDTIKTSYSWAKHFVSSSRGLTSSNRFSTLCTNWTGFWVCLNTDGSVKYENGSATAGGIVRNQSVEWIFGFNRFLGSYSCLRLNYGSILDGLDILIDRGYDHILIHVDNLETIRAFQENPIGRSNSTLIRRILQVMSRFESWSISHIPIKDNQEADSLVKLAHRG
ncbi:hypothetical protein Goarm_023374, partial [Gossypium armourianum]|nr:hypothetical protein [Gossypium armourianum]